MKLRVIVLQNFQHLAYPSDISENQFIRDYFIDHDDSTQRRVLGEQCRNAFEGGQCVVTFPVGA